MSYGHAGVLASNYGDELCWCGCPKIGPYEGSKITGHQVIGTDKVSWCKGRVENGTRILCPKSCGEYIPTSQVRI